MYFLSNLLLIISSAFFFILGRHFSIIRKIPHDFISEEIESIKNSIRPPRSRIISPSKNQSQSLKEFENQDI